MTADRRYTRVTWKIMEQLLEVDSIGDALSGSLEIIYNRGRSGCWTRPPTAWHPCFILALRISPASLWKTGWA